MNWGPGIIKKYACVSVQERFMSTVDAICYAWFDFV